MNRFYVVLAVLVLVLGIGLWYLLHEGTHTASAAAAGPPPTVVDDGFRGYTVGDANAPVEITEYVDYECPAKYPEKLRRELETDSVAIFHILGCRDVARVDFRIRDGVPYFLEINPLPGLNPATSDLPIMAKMVGIPHAKLMKLIIDAACARNGLS